MVALIENVEEGGVRRVAGGAVEERDGGIVEE